MQNKSAQRIQFELACIRHAYRNRGETLNTPRAHPLAILAVYTASGFVAFGVIALIFNLAL